MCFKQVQDVICVLGAKQAIEKTLSWLQAKHNKSQLVAQAQLSVTDNARHELLKS
jgi:hypothetical protein